ncbi:MAG: response regulator [Acidobacteriota bacterium]
MNKILLIGNDPESKQALRRQLSELGLEVEEAAAGEEAVKRCAADDYGLVIADLDIPVMCGLPFVQRLKLRNPDLPVIVLSAFQTLQNTATALRCGADALMGKPVDPGAFQEAVRFLCAGASAR